MLSKMVVIENCCLLLESITIATMSIYIAKHHFLKAFKCLLLLIPAGIICPTLTRSQNPADLVELFPLRPKQQESGEQFGAVVAIEGKTAAVTSFYKSDGTALKGAVYLFEEDPNHQWREKQRIIGTGAYTRLGYNVALTGDYLICGDHAYPYDAQGTQYLNKAGVVRIYKKEASGMYILHQIVTASDRKANGYFGLKIAADGQKLLVSSYLTDHESNGKSTPRVGAVYVFELQPDERWIETSKILPETIAAERNFGQYISISGNTAVINSTEYLPDNNQHNHLHIYKENTHKQWVLEKTFTHTGNVVGEVSISDDHIAMGIIGFNNNVGKVYTYHKDASDTWQIHQELTPLKPVANMGFGNNVAVKDSLLAIASTAFKHRGVDSIKVGVIELYKLTASGTWQRVKQLFSSDGSRGDSFASSSFYGSGLALSNSGHLIAGAMYKHHADIPLDMYGGDKDGAAYIFGTLPYPCWKREGWIEVRACNSYTVPSGKQTHKASGSYRDTITTTEGCDSITHINLYIDSLSIKNTAVWAFGVDNSKLFYAGDINLGPMQWLNCSSGYTPVPNAYGNTLQNAAPGSYALMQTHGTCVDTTDCFPLLLSSIAEDNNLKQTLSLYPNPAIDQFKVHGITEKDSWTVTDLHGIKLLRGYGPIVDITQLPKGFFIVEAIGQRLKFTVSRE